MFPTARRRLASLVGAFILLVGIALSNGAVTQPTPDAGAARPQPHALVAGGYRCC